MTMGFTSLKSRILEGLLGDAEEVEPPRGGLLLEMLSDWLPYRVFDARSRLYLNARSKGFVLGVTPLIGADERTAEILGQFFSEGLPPGACLQILHHASPRISRIIAPWFAPRYAQGGVYEAIARHRANRMYDLVWNSGSKDAPFHTRHHQLFLSLGVPSQADVSNEELVQCRDGLMAMLRSLNRGVHEIEPQALIALIDDLTSPTTAPQDDVCPYNPLDPISSQALRRDIELLVEEDRMLLRTERFRATGEENEGVPEIGTVYPDCFDIRHYGVRNMPLRWAPWECSRLIGDLFTDKLRFPCPTATMLCLIYPSQEAAAARAGYKFMRTTSLAGTKSARFLPKIAEQSAEWQHVQAELQEGRKLAKVFYGVTAYSPLGDGDRNERAIKSIYKAAGWDLIDERFLQIQGLLAAMPLTLADGLAKDMERLKRMKTLLSTTAANIAPMQGEYLGGPLPHLLFVGRRGQPFFWSPFENEAGNHNVAICGKSGSGKSVLLQEMCAALRGAGAQVVVIDDGRSFEHSVKLQGGRFVEFTLASGFCLNPFSMIDAERAEQNEDYRLDCFGMVKAIIGQMARHSETLSDAERGFVDSAVMKVWSEEGTKGSIDGIARALVATANPIAENLAVSIAPYMAGGSYGAFFTGQASIDLDADFTVFEMSDLATREDLRSVVLSAIMFMTSQAMTRSPRSVRKLLLIDEAWSMLKGGSMGEFVETYARTCRKYGGSLATATQSLNDYYKSDGATAALENSDWMLILQQKPETIADFKRASRLDMDDRTETLIRSLKRSGADYSEVFIKGPEVESIGRLVLDDYSATLFSSSPDTFAKIDAELARGMQLADAIERIAFPQAF
ncbi:MAG TPA: type IV secretion system protein TraC [Sphingorhabdus sp.]|uniref:type IV secretion system protein TraC n=1 Tax=Sphingorhabdus sp. TaxID=1902408 RepID=UPI002D147D6B|nr:type IV secretion system protein TraC [Sphingorhabdus sp.]HMT42549.1 type IV secretion system protein TraC [Sphingorhabdus sp.]HMU21356.1 type IV secretion system protein TraC [Sphingorhabdus sp.]